MSEGDERMLEGASGVLESLIWCVDRLQRLPCTVSEGDKRVLEGDERVSEGVRGG